MQATSRTVVAVTTGLGGESPRWQRELILRPPGGGD